MNKNIVFKVFACTICFLFILSVVSAHAVSSQDWISYLPETINGIEKTGEVETVDAKKMGQKISSVTQVYGNNVSLTIADGTMLPQLKKFEAMKQLTMENEKKIIKRMKISGYESGYEFYKKRKEGNLLVKLSDTRIVVIQADEVKNKDELLSMADDVPLSEIADHK